MYQALYRKYRPSSFDDVCGQEHITSVLRTQLQKGRVSHAYIFCGSRGTGKTTCAKILAKAVNCENLQNGEPCNECDSCRAINEEQMMDVVEMDAASNNGVDHIRRICDEVQFLPSEGKKRVYIIDEVHMLSTSAFNALLKTIEEPPAHVLFILATTEMNDIPATIMSRCQRFDFKRITAQVVSDRLMKISEKEGIALKEEAAAVIARLSDGAMRDALSLLEACQSYEGDITAEAVHGILGLGSRSSVLELCRAVSCGDVEFALELVHNIYGSLSDFKEVIASMIAVYRDVLVIKSVDDFRKYIDCYEGEIATLEEIASKLSFETALFQSAILEDFYKSYDRIATGKKAASEILMIRLCKEELSQDTAAILSRISKLEKAMESGALPRTHTVKPTVEDKEKPVSAPEKVIEPEKKVPSTSESSFEGSVKLKNALGKEAFLKPWLPQMDFEKRGNALFVLTGSFVKGVLASSNCEELIRNALEQIDGSITSVVFEEKKINGSPSVGTDLAEL